MVTNDNRLVSGRPQARNAHWATIRCWLVVVLMAVFVYAITYQAMGSWVSDGARWFNGQVKQKTGINLNKPIPRITVQELNEEIKKKTGINPKTPVGKAGNNLLFKGWKPFREPALPVERLATKAMTTLDETSKWTALFLDTMIWNTNWPDRFPKQPVKQLAHPSLEFSIQRAAINAAMALYKDEVIPLGRDDHIVVGSLDLRLDSSRNVYVLDVSGGKLVYKFIRENSFHVKSAQFEVIPVIQPHKDKLILAIKTRCVYLDIESCPAAIDRFAAYAINEGLETRQDGVIATVDLTDRLARPFDMQTKPQMEAVAHLTEATVFVSDEAITAQVAFNLTKQTPKSPVPLPVRAAVKH